MKHTFFFIPLCVVFTLVACNGTPKPAQHYVPPKSDTAWVGQTFTLKFKSMHLSDSTDQRIGAGAGHLYANNTLVADYPVDGADEQVQWLRQWMVLSLLESGCVQARTPAFAQQTYVANSLPDSTLTYFFKKMCASHESLLHDLENAQYDTDFFLTSNMSFRVVGQAEKWLTYVYENACSQTGHYSTDDVNYMVFDLVENRQLTFGDIVLPVKQEEFRRILLKRVVACGKLTSEAEFLDLPCMAADSLTVTNFTLPYSDFGFAPDGMVAHYSNEQLGFALDRAIDVVLPYEEVWECLAPAAKKLLGEKKNGGVN